MREAAIVLIEEGGEVLVVWNSAYGGWSLPGGKLEDGETPQQAAIRELEEETGLVVRDSIAHKYTGISKQQPGTKGLSREMRVHLFVAWPHEDPRSAQQKEEGCPVGFMPMETLLDISPFREFYKEAFVSLEDEAKRTYR